MVECDDSPMLDAKSLKAYIADHEVMLNEQFFETKISELQIQRAELFDKLLTRLWHRYDLHQFSSISLNAVGGYGRQTLHPKSDIDICILHEKELTKEQGDKLSTFLTKLWDLGVDIGSSVRTLRENVSAAKSDITIATNLLDIRTLAGSSSHACSILKKLYSDQIITSDQFLTDKSSEQEGRHKKANNTPLYLEPNIKNNPGGMRDVQTIFWIARKHFNVNDTEALKTLGFLKTDEYFELMESYDFICRIRWALHTVAKRPVETLLFDYQCEVAEFMKFGHGENSQLAVEKMMRQLFRAMTRIRELNQMMLGVIQRKISTPKKYDLTQVDLDEHFFVSQHLIQAKYDEVFFNKANVVRLFRLIAENDDILDIAPETLRLLRQTRRSLLGELQDYQECRYEFLQIIKHKNGLKRAFGLMHRYGVIASYFPEWNAIEGQMQFDMHNAYTVDEHAFKLIQYVDEFTQLRKSKQLVGSIYKESVYKHVLVIAGLCHDLSGKQSHENNEFSAMFAKEFAQLHDLKKSDVELITWLVEKQNLLLSTVQTLDIQDSEVIKSVAKHIGTEIKLNALYCFTVADIKATNEQSWNEWQESLLNELYFALRNALKSGIENVFEQRTIIRENKNEAIETLVSLGFYQAEINSLWGNFTSSFFSSNQVNEIVRFTEQILINHNNEHTLALVDDPNLECTNLLVYAKDRNSLFVDLFNTLSSLKICVKEAQLYQTKDGKVLEIIKVLDHNDDPITDEYRGQQIIKRIDNLLNESTSTYRPAKPSFVKNFENSPEIEFITTSKTGRALLRVNALDNPLFIEKICNVFKQKELTIHSAKISSLGESSENVFSISAKDNMALSLKDKEELTKMLLDKIA
ncbi:bifunctional uridylyltransferase/uridylyl-removing enzyme [Thalassotalea loyana]|uniref:Bifunctional uridylyltransferase/uridylyl-removing enzyme n=1 Tax=Thalassotalea loyana TaxID=280483 RepID=A0ABQ6HB62_9GAMM|nr:[protein-PII] uridylyltransferase [Thalassotalea loyana]GLX84560.1 bifunctional uridylyltransferase/uridylyl-removing enzyme [Thalassotalea loyana]